MWESIINMAADTGLWAMLFVILFIIQIKENKTRESKYQETIASLADKLKIVNDISESVNKIYGKFHEE